MQTVDFSRIPTRAGDRFLDIGCGSGRHTAAAFELQKTTVIGVDINLRDVLEAERRLRFHQKMGAGGGSWGLALADACRLSFKRATFDKVICSEVLEHIQSESRLLLEINRVLKPCGHLLLSVPRFGPERICWALAEQYHTTAGGHLRIYRKASLLKQLKASGFIPLAHHYAHALHTPYWWLKCLVGPQRTDVRLVDLYQRLLVWDIMKKPRVMRMLDRLANPWMGKSLVLYLQKVDSRHVSA